MILINRLQQENTDAGSYEAASYNFFQMTGVNPGNMPGHIVVTSWYKDASGNPTQINGISGHSKAMYLDRTDVVTGRQRDDGLSTLNDGLENINKILTVGNLTLNSISSTGSGVKNLKFATGAVTGTAIGITVASGYIDYRMMKTGQISKGEFAYNTTGAFIGTTGGLVVGSSYGGFAGAAFGFAVGVGFDFGKMLYNGFNQLQHDANVWKNDLIRNTMSSPFYSPF